MVRFKPGTPHSDWIWADPERSFNGHAALCDRRQLVYTTETNLANGAGLVGVREPYSLSKIAEWPTHGIDPHAVVIGPNQRLYVANGGIATQSERGRAKVNLSHMDSSLTALDAASGALLGQWRLPDQRLSMRHLAWDAERRLLGVALQAEHDEVSNRQTAPILAVFNGADLRLASSEQSAQSMAGYGGDIAFHQGRFWVSCPRAHGVAQFDRQGIWLDFVSLEGACALAAPERNAAGSSLWLGGQHQALEIRAWKSPGGNFSMPMRLDNHWISLPS